jgi:hypothetical protein
MLTRTQSQLGPSYYTTYSDYHQYRQLIFLLTLYKPVDSVASIQQKHPL